MSALTDLIFAGSNAVAGLTEGAVNAAIEKYGPEQKIAFPDTAYFFPTIYAATGVKVAKPGDLPACVGVLKSLITFHLEEDEEDVRVAARTGENLLEVARRGRVPVFAPCDGDGSCGKCRVQILKGTLNASRSFYIADVEYEEGWRLACTARVAGDATLLVKD